MMELGSSLLARPCAHLTTIYTMYAQRREPYAIEWGGKRWYHYPLGTYAPYWTDWYYPSPKARAHFYQLSPAAQAQALKAFREERRYWNREVQLHNATIQYPDLERELRAVYFREIAYVVEKRPVGDANPSGSSGSPAPIHLRDR